MRLTHTIVVQASRDTAGKRRLFWTESGTEAEQIDTLDGCASSVFSLLPSAVDTLALGRWWTCVACCWRCPASAICG